MTREEKKRNMLFRVTMVLMSLYLLWRIFFTLPIHEGFWNMVFGILLMMAEAVTVLTTFELFIQKMQAEKYHLDCPDLPPEDYPEVDVFIATHNEPTDLLYKTVNACTFMDYPDKSKVHIFLCDDGNRPEAAALAQQLGVGYLGLDCNKQAKSGNLNNALAQTHAPLIATFDADMIPQHTFLMKTVPYFLLPRFIKENDVWRKRTQNELDPSFRIGLVQTPQSFYNPDLFQFNLYAEKNIPNEQDFFSKEINVMRNASNAVAYTGSNTVLAREAIEAIGGFPLKTITEDFETSARIQMAGFITYATDEIQAAGLTATTIGAMFRQRTRWARGVIQSLQNTHAIFSKKLPLAARITYLNSFLYWWSFFFRLIFILAPILFALFDFQIVNTGFWHVIFFWLPAYFCYSLSMRHLSGNIRNQRWSQVIDTILMPYLIFPVLLETLHIHQKKFKVTNKKREAGGEGLRSLLYSIPHAALLLLSLVALFRFLHGKYGWALLYSSVIIFWIAYNMVALFYALFFMLGRRAYRNTERIQAAEPIVIQFEDISYRATTVDVSETGAAFIMKDPVYLPERTALSMTITTPFYKASLLGKILYVKRQKDGWRYSATVQPVDEENRRQYMQIIYDRIHSLPKQMNLWDTAYDDMLRNVLKRLNHPFADQRKMPRIPLNRPVVFTNGAAGTLKSFNYHFFSVSGFQPNGAAGDRFLLLTQNGIRITLIHTGRQTANGKEELFEVENLNDLLEQHLIHSVLDDLTDPRPIKNGGC